MHQTKFEILSGDGTLYGEIPGFAGVYANADTLEACREELEEVLKEWIVFRISKNLLLPVVDGITLTISRLDSGTGTRRLVPGPERIAQ